MMKNKTIYLRPGIIVFAAIAACFVYLLSATWLKWGSIFIDTFRDLLLPLDLINGKVLYKDISYPYGFLPPYILSLAYMIFGVHILSIVRCGIAVTILICIFIYKIANFFLSEVYSGFVVITFLFVFAFGFYVGNGIFNFILPYSFASTCFSLFSAVALYYFIAFIFTTNKEKLLFWSLFSSLSLLSRPDMSLLLWLGYIFCGIIFMVKCKGKIISRILIYLLSPLILTTVCYLFFLHINHAYGGFKESIIDCIMANTNTSVAIRFAGIDNIAQNSFYILKSFLYNSIIVLFLAMVSSRTLNFNKNYRDDGLVLPMHLILIFAIFMITKNYFNSDIQYRCLPLLIIMGITILFIQTMRSSDYKRSLSLLTLFVISLAMMVRVFFNATPHQYGFYTLSLGIICYYIFFFDMAKNWLKLPMRLCEGKYSISMLIFFIFLILPHWGLSASAYRMKDILFTDERGDIFCWCSKDILAFCRTIDYLKNNTLQSETVAVLPEGVAINFFSKRNTPLRYYTFLPPDVKTIGEDKMIADLIRSNVDYIVITDRDTTEYGYPAFGKDYAKKLYAWIGDNYEVVEQFGPTPNTTSEFGIAILRKKLARLRN